MKYLYQALSKTSAVIELAPETETEKKLLQDFDRSDPDQDALYHYYQKGLELNNKSAMRLSINRFIRFPSKAAISFDIMAGLGS